MTSGGRVTHPPGLDEIQGFASELVTVMLPAVRVHDENVPPIIESEFLQSQQSEVRLIHSRTGCF